MIPLDIELESNLRDLINDCYKMELGEESDKIPNITKLVKEWWATLESHKQDNIKRIFSKMESFSEYDQQSKKDQIFNKFKDFYCKHSEINLDDKDSIDTVTNSQKVFKPLVADVKFSKIAQQNKDKSTTKNIAIRSKNKLRQSSKTSNSPNLQPNHPTVNKDKKTIPKPKTTNIIKVYNKHKDIADSTMQPQKQSVVRRSEKVKELTPYHLQNGTVGKEYNEILDLKKIYPEGTVSDYSIGGLEEIGLELNKKSKLIHGVPTKAGDPNENYEFEMIVRYETNKKVKASKKVFIKILPDPKTLWKVLEPSSALGDSKDHEYHQLIALDSDTNDKERKLFVASKRGRSHAHKGTYRDDHVKIDCLQDIGWSIISVADGAGSAKFSRVGSKIACNESVKHITSQLIEKSDELDQVIKDIYSEKQGEKKDVVLQLHLFEILAHAAYRAAKSIQDEAVSRKLTSNDFNTTLLITIHKKYAFGDFIAGFWIGDGALAIYNEKKEVILLGKPDAGAFSGQTKFITMKQCMETDVLAKRVHYHLLHDFTALMVMSDGVSDPEFGTDKNLFNLNYWDALWAKLQNEFHNSNNKLDEKLLNWLDFWAEGEHDDRSIAILY